MANEFTLNVPQSNIGPYLMSVAESLGGGLERFQLAQQQRQQQAIEEQRRREFQQQFQRDMIAHSKDGSAESLAMLLSRYPSMKEPIMTVYKAANEEQRNNELADLLPAYSAWDNLDPETTYEIVNKRREAARNAGDQNQFNRYDKLAKAIENNSDAATGLLQWRIAELVGPDKVVETISGIQTMRPKAREAEAVAGTKEAEKRIKDIELQRLPGQLGLADEKTQADIKNINSQIAERDSKLLLDAYKAVNDGSAKAAEILRMNTEIPEWLHKEVYKLQVDASAYGQSSSNAYDLSIKLSTSDMPSGPIAKWSKWMDDQFGITDTAGVIRKEYERLDTDRVIDKLGALKGAASDRDVALVKNVGLSSISDPKVLSQWLAGLAKAQAYAKATAYLKTKFIEQNGNKGLMGSQRDMNVGGYDVKSGMSFGDFEDKYRNKIFADAVRSLESGYLTRSSYMQGVDINAPEQEFAPQGYGEGMPFPPEEQ